MGGQAQDKVALVFGASRGIGRQIALSLAGSGYFVVLSSKSTGILPDGKAPDPNTPQSTIDTVLKEVQAAGGAGAAIPCDVRDDLSIKSVITEVMTRYGRCDAMIYNPGAVWWSAVERTPTKRYDLMHQVNTRGLYVSLQEILPIFRQQGFGRIVSVSPPIYSRFVKGKTSYAMTKFAASVMTLGLAVDFEREFTGCDVAITSLWPTTAVESAATAGVPASEMRNPKIFGDAVIAILKSQAKLVNGRLLLDEDFLRESGNADEHQINAYAVVPGTKPRRMMPVILPDLRVAEQDDEGQRKESAKARARL